MKRIAASLSFFALLGLATAQTQPLTLRDIQDKSPRQLSKDEVTALMTGAKMSRISVRGSRNYWTNETSGSFVASSDNMGAGAIAGAQGRNVTAPGKWHISDDGRYCILIEWRTIGAEEWCRFVLAGNDGNYYTARSTSQGTERVEKFEIKR